MKTCLVVDDSSVIRKIARRILEEMNFQIVKAEDGKQARGICGRGLPDGSRSEKFSRACPYSHVTMLPGDGQLPSSRSVSRGRL
jgi:hypothetical protein